MTEIIVRSIEKQFLCGVAVNKINFEVKLSELSENF